jgi:thymidylate synthase (FAD)
MLLLCVWTLLQVDNRIYGKDIDKMSQILVELQEFMGSDRKIAEAAWTSSYSKDKREEKTDEQVADLVPNLIKDGHGTPIESVIFRFWIRLPIFTDRQHMTHRIASHNGLSGRYRTMPDDWYHVPEDVQDIMVKAYGEPRAGKIVYDQFDQLCLSLNEWYKTQIFILKDGEKKGRLTNQEFKRAREILRGILPTAGMVERTTIMNLRSFANYQFQRNSDHAQKEIRMIAQMMLEEVKAANVAPVAIKTLEEIGWKI